jgi:23S rRNA pseudouridine1911/1915/1917 synthase
VRADPRGAVDDRLVRRVAQREDGRRLVDVLLEWLQERLSAEVPMARVRALVASSGVRVDGAVVRAPGRLLRRGQHVEAPVDPARLQSRALRLDRPFELTAERILFRDSFLLAVDKPPGLPTHATADRSRPSLVAHVERFLAAAGPGAGPAVGAPTVAVHQRLDRDTSGVVVFGLDPRANAGLVRAFAGRLAHKAYLAITAAPRTRAAKRFRVDVPLGPDRRPAVTDVLVQEALKDALLVEARPLTGRKHQVRAHLAHAGLPILGDPVYGRSDARAPRLMLHAWRLELPHPVTGEPLRLEAEVPADFAAVLAERRRG